MDGTIRTLFSAKLEEGVERKELPCPMRERERVAITNNDGRGGRRGAESKDTVVGVHVGSSAGVYDPKCASLVHRHLV